MGQKRRGREHQRHGQQPLAGAPRRPQPAAALGGEQPAARRCRRHSRPAGIAAALPEQSSSVTPAHRQ